MKNSSNYSISFSPSEEQFQEIKKWLFKENQSSQEGFYCNWPIIKKYFDDKKLAIFLNNNEAIGFVCWKVSSKISAEISLFEIRPDSRYQGLGTCFVIKLLEFFISKNLHVAELQCSPEESESFWRKFNFINVPEGIRFFADKHLYKILIPHQEPVLNYDGSTYLEIWDNEPHATRNKQSRWKWAPIINDEKTRFELPIIHPYNDNWRIRVIHQGIPIIDGKIKRFRNIDDDPGNFILINELPHSTN